MAQAHFDALTTPLGWFETQDALAGAAWFDRELLGQTLIAGAPLRGVVIEQRLRPVVVTVRR